MNGDSVRRRQVIVTGATGLVGEALVHRLVDLGYGVVALTRDAAAAGRRFARGEVRCVETLDDVPTDSRIEAIVHLAGARVLDRRWTSSRKKVLEESRLRIASDVRRLVGRLARKLAVLVSASAVSVYGAGSQERLTERSALGETGFGAQLCARIEREALRAREFGVRVVPLRLGIVLARTGGALPPLALSARLGLAARLGTGQQPVSWISLSDAVRLVVWLIESATIDGPVNAAAPDMPCQAEFARTLAAHFGRRARLWIPVALLRFMLGERASLLLEGQRAVPAAVLEGGFVFEHPSLSSAFRDIFAPRSTEP